MSDLNVSKNPALLFDLNADHNGVKCIASLKLEDQGTECQYWFTAKMLCDTFGVADRTIRDNIQSLIDDGEIGLCENPQRRINVEDSTGVPHPVNLYNLEVLNKLGMCCFRGNKKAKEIRNKFNDVLVKAETGCIRTVEDLINDPDTAIQMLSEIKTLRLKNKQLEVEKHELELNNKSLKAQNGVLSQDYKSNKDICEEIIAEGLTKYALSTLKSKVSKVLQKLSHEQGYSISEQVIVVEGVERKTPFYHIDVCNQIKEKIKEDPFYLKSVR